MKYQIKKQANKLLAFCMVLVMVLTSITFTPIVAKANEAGGTTLTIHFKNEKNWEKVYAKFGSGSSWDAISGLEYCKDTEFGGLISQNTKNPGWYSFKVTSNTAITELNGLFNGGAWGDTTQTANYKITVAEGLEAWITFTDTSKNVSVSYTNPEGWGAGAEINAPIDPATLSTVKSPVISEDGSVTFNLEISEETLLGTKPYLMGTVPGTNWGPGLEMTDEDGDGVYSVTVPNIKPGRYQYKFKYGENTWITDPSNTEKESGNSLLVVPGFLISAENPAGVGSFKVEAEVTGDIETSSIEWYVTDEQGNDVTGISVAGDSEDKTKAVITTTKDAKTGYFLVGANYKSGDKDKSADTKLYFTEKAFLYEYEYKVGSQWTGKSDIFTWYNSQAGNVGAKFREVNGKNTAYITLDDTTKNFGYIVRLPGNWGASEAEDREFSDRTLTAYEADRYTKVKGGEGIEVPYMLPSAKTEYDNGILFKWRDDDRFYNNTMDELKDKTVQVVISKDNQTVTKPMAYSEKDELFTYHYTGEEGNYQFYFMVDGQRVEDQYLNGTIEYKKPELEINTKVTPEEVSYNENPVVSFEIKDKNTRADVEVASIVADLTSLGYTGQTVAFQPLSKEGVLYVDRNVTPGTYQVPFTITDKWGNKTKINVDVKVKAKTDSDTPWDESRIYFLLTDRFVNGDKTNDYNCAPDMIEAYHGGDFKGLTSKLGYLQELGINTIWITPIVDNIDKITNTQLHQQGYHGYWAKDFTTIDEHLGNTEDLDNLIDEADKRGIKIMVDIVVNHAGYDTANQNNFAGMFRTDEEEVKGDVITGRLDGMPDFKTEDPNVRAKLIAWQTAWANHTTPGGNRIAYFRVDTVKHVEHDTWQDLKTSLAKVNPSFKMIGEYFGAGVSNTGDYLGNGQMDALLDFDFKSTASSFVNGNIDSVETTLENRNQKLSNSKTLGQFLSSHDENGFLYNQNNDTAKMKVAAALQMTAKGTPIIYYGEEINLTGPNEFGNPNNNRYDMQFDNLTEEQNAMLTHYKKLLAARTMYSKVFAAGTRNKVAGSNAAGYLVFKRSYGSENVYVGLNTTNQAKEVTFSVDETEGLMNLYSGEEVTVSENSVTVTIPANTDGGTVILAKGKQLTDVIFQGPMKTSYTVGEELNLDGITVTGVYDTVKVPISAYTVNQSEFNKDKAGTYTITVAYGNKSKEYQVTVSEKTISMPFPVGPGIPSQPTENYTVSLKNENSIQVEAEITEGKAAISEITADVVSQVVNTKNEESKVDTLTIDLSGAKQEVTAVKLSKSSVETLAKVTNDKENGIDTTTIVLTQATVELDNKTLQTIVDKAKGTDVEIVVEAKEQKSLNKTQQVSLSKYEVATTFEVHISSEGEKIHDFNGGTVVVEVKFTPQIGKNPNYYHVVYVAENGVITRYKTKYKDGKIFFTTTHFSDYAIIYDDTEKNASEEKEPENPITPVTNFSTLRARSVVQTSNSINLKWNKVAKADGYIIYGGAYSTKDKKYTMKQLVTISNNSKLTWTHKKLTKATNYKYKVKAYKLVDGKKVIIANSVDVFAVTKGGKYGVAKRVDLISLGSKKNTNKITLAQGKTVQIKAKAVKADKPIKNQGKLQYESSNTKVATVTKDGKIKAVGKGNCYIYIYAQNGVYKTVKVTVK